jgi:hypothetical protein
MDLFELVDVVELLRFGVLTTVQGGREIDPFG